MSARFARFASACAHWAGTPQALALALALVLGWGALGPLFRWSDTWHRVGDIPLAIAPFVMLFVLQATQARDTKALQAKLDELIHATQGARDELLHIEDEGEEVIDTRRLDPAREGE